MKSDWIAVVLTFCRSRREV